LICSFIFCGEFVMRNFRLFKASHGSFANGRHSGANSGFSLIEVLIAVIVLSTGMLALGALQMNLTASGADAKARSRVASLLSSTLDDARANGYDNIATFAATSCVTSAPTALQTAICNAQSDAGVSNLQLAQTSTHYYGLSGANTFTTTAPALTVSNYSDYKQVGLTATWSDAAGTTRLLGASTIASKLGLTSSSTILVQPLVSGGTGGPIVHETNPNLTAGVIPIAVGANTDTASTNPRPQLGVTLPSTTFTTLTYQGDSFNNNATATIQKRVETAVAECACAPAGSNLTNDVFLGTTTFRPTYWNGTSYGAPSVPSPAIAPTFGQKSGVIQNDLCTQCCRDHHDVNSDVVKFDPFTGDLNRYKATVITTGNGNNAITTVTLTKDAFNNPIIAGPSDTYLDACRLIRTDGLWRVAADMNSEQMGLIATTVKGFATSSTPDPASAAAYEDFVIDYLGQRLDNILNSAAVPVANTVFASHGLNDPATIDITTVAGTYRYLHSRGLYLDHLEASALAKLQSVNSSCAAANYPQCLLPYLPFNTINVTELANWSAAPSAKLAVTNGSTACVAGAPIRGCVSGKTTGAATATVVMGHSNSAMASSLAVSPYELNVANQKSDLQTFNVEGSITAQEFFVALTGLSQTSDLSTSNDPSVTWGVSGSSDFCFTQISRIDTDPNPYDCVTTVNLLLPVTVTLGNYNLLANQTVANPCPSGNGTVSQPVLTCNTATGISGLSGNYNATSSVSGYKTTGEQTVISITANGNGTTNLTNNTTLGVVFGPNSSASATYICDPVTHIPAFTTPTTCN
jgi:prepilin-type N-terminal cleavage/methylation domain-containing protein